MDVSVSMFLWTLVTFAVVAYVLSKFAWKPILAGLERREEDLRKSIENADRLEREIQDIDKTRQEALVFARLMGLYAGYHQGRSPIVKITDAGRVLPLAHSKAGTAVLAVPVDYVSWTKRTGESVTAFAKSAAKQPGDKKLELWVQGRVSDTARKELGGLGWAVFDRAFERLEKGAK